MYRNNKIFGAISNHISDLMLNLISVRNSHSSSQSMTKTSFSIFEKPVQYKCDAVYHCARRIRSILKSPPATVVNLADPGCFQYRPLLSHYPCPFARNHKPSHHPLPLTFSATNDYKAELSSLVTTSSKV